LGGQVIARQLKSSLGIDADTGANFFHGHGGDTHARWSEFWQFAGEAIAEDGIEEVCNSASEIFVRFKRSLTWADGYWTFIDHLSRQAKDVPRTSKVYFDRDH
jgi:heme oxygenase